MLRELKLPLPEDVVDDPTPPTKKQLKRLGALVNAINNIVATAKVVVTDLAGNFYSRHLEIDSPYSYTDKLLAGDEIDFYTKCITVEGVLNLHHQRIIDELNLIGPFQLFPTDSFSEVQMKGK